MIGAVLAPKEYLAILPSVDIKYLLLCAGYCFWGITQVNFLPFRTHQIPRIAQGELYRLLTGCDM